MNRGYIKVWRKLEDSGIIGNAEVCQMLLYLMLKASRKARKYSAGTQILELQPGQFVTGRKQLAAALNSTEQRIRTALKFLEKHEIINQQPTNKFTIISLINWNKYQDDEQASNQQSNQQSTSIQPAANQQLTTKQEVKKLRRVKTQEEPNGSSSPEPGAAVSGAPPASPVLAPVISLPLNTGEEHPVTQGEIDQWKDLYPAVDVMQALRNMRGWLLGTPKKRKTKAGVGRFIHTWLAKDQDQGGNLPANVRNGPPAARTQFQKGRQDLEGCAADVLTADMEDFAHGFTTTNRNGTETHGHALPASVGQGERIAAHGSGMGGALP